MSRFMLLLAVYLVGAVIVPAPTLSQEALSVSEAQDDGSQAAPQAEQRLPGVPIRIIEEPAPTENDVRQQIEGAERERKDLIAQESVAGSTKELVEISEKTYDIGLFQALVSVVGTGAVIYTLRLNRRATGAAIVAAQAAERAAVAAENALNTDRAWLFVEGFTISRKSGGVTMTSTDGENEEYDRGLEFTLKWVNSGKSPAVGVSYICERRTIPTEYGLETFELTSLNEYTSTLGPGQKSESTVPFGCSELENALRDGYRYFIYARVDYRTTTSSEAKFTEFTVEIVCDGLTTDPITGSWPLTRTIIVGPQNKVT